MKRIGEVDPGRRFISGELSRDDFLYGGLQWEIMVNSGKYYAVYYAAPDGSSVCLHSSSDDGKSGPINDCPDFGHQPKGIPAPD
jgi:hypothetical protein